MQITNIKEQVKNPDRVSIFLDGSYSFSLTLSQLLDQKLKLHDEIDQQRLKNLQKLSEEGKFKIRALDWLLIRPHSSKEFQDYLRRKKADPDFGQKLILEFTSNGYLNDEHFAKWFAEFRLSKNRSIRAIKSELRYKGIQSEIIESVISELAVKDNAQLKNLIIKKRQQTRYSDETKLKSYLLRQGFNYSDVKQALEELK